MQSTTLEHNKPVKPRVHYKRESSGRVYAYISAHGKTVKMSTKVICPKGEWSAGFISAKSEDGMVARQNLEDFNSRLLSMDVNAGFDVAEIKNVMRGRYKHGMYHFTLMNAINYGYDSYAYQMAEATRERYKYVIDSFTNFLDEVMDLDDVMDSEINSSISNHYQNYLMENGLNISTVKHNIKLLATMYDRFVMDHESTTRMSPQNPFRITLKKMRNLTYNIPSRRRMEIQSKTLSEEQIEQIKEYKFYGKKKHSNERWKNLILWQIYTGFSFGDLCRYNWKIKKTDSEKKYIELFRGKTGNRCVIPFTNEVEEVYNFFKENRTRHSFFPIKKCRNIKQRRLYHGRYRNFLEKFSKMIAMDLTTHLFRHTFGMLMSKRGVSIHDISLMMGHSSIATTEEFYVRPQDDTLISNVMSVLDKIEDD